MRSLRHRLPLGAVAALLFLLPAVSGCGGGSAGAPPAPEGFAELELTLDGLPDPETVGVLTAEDSGELREAGIGLTVGTPLAPERPIGYVADGLSDIVVSYLPQVVLARDEGVPVVALGSLVPHTTMAMIWLPGSGISGVADLKGKTIAIPGVPFQRDFLEAALKQSGISPGEVKVVVGNYELVTLLEEGRVDAIFGGSGNVEGAMLEAHGRDPVVTPATELGVPDYDELVFVTRRDRLARHPDLYRRFVEAANAGVQTALEDPATGDKAVVDHYLGEPPPEGLRASLDATLPLLSEDGEIDPQRTADLIAWMHDEGMIKREPPVSAVVSEGEE